MTDSWINVFPRGSRLHALFLYGDEQRRRNERYFHSGIELVNLIEASSKQVSIAMESSGRNPRRNKHSAAFEALKLEAEELRRTLLSVRAHGAVVCRDERLSTRRLRTSPCTRQSSHESCPCRHDRLTQAIVWAIL